MKKLILPLAGMMILAGCRSSSNEIIEEQNIPDSCTGTNCTVVRVESPNGNDLVLETDRHIIEIQAPADIPYSYYVWTGDKKVSDDPDLIVEDGKSMVLVEE
jgi:hypothetical protein